MNFTHIVFDIDGTLLDSESAVLFSLRDIIEENQKRTVGLDELRFSLGIPGTDALKRLGFDDPEYFNTLWEKKFRDYYGLMRIFDGIKGTLEKLKAKDIMLGIITSKNRREYRNDFVPFGLAGYFDTVVCAEDSVKHKPFPEPMEKFLELSGAAPEQVLYIGDTLYDLQCAKGAGVKFALAKWGCKASGIAADYFLDAPEDILSPFSCKFILHN
jgi:haloacid dehalogenase superfamily, subfamily IA, variant 1 with third motif having Dx(3-4)D or Dx(3-4)E